MTLLVDATTAQHARGIGTVVSGILGELGSGGHESTIVAVGPDLVGRTGATERSISVARTRLGRLAYQRLLLPADIARLSRHTTSIDRVLLLDAYAPLLTPQRGVRYAQLCHNRSRTCSPLVRDLLASKTSPSTDPQRP